MDVTFFVTYLDVKVLKIAYFCTLVPVNVKDTFIISDLTFGVNFNIIYFV